jgi:hypothetical protein
MERSSTLRILYLLCSILGVSFSEGSLAFFIAVTRSPELACYRDLGLRPEYQALKGGFRPRSEDDRSFALYANQNRPTEQEKRLIALYIEEQERCRAAAKHWREANSHPAIRDLVDKSFNDYLALAARLYRGDITYGEFHQAIDSGERQTQSELDRVHRALDEQSQLEEAEQAAFEAEVWRTISRTLWRPPKSTTDTNCMFLAAS